MLIGIEQKLDRIQKEQMSFKGTLAVIDGELNFRHTDGFIQFMRLALNQISKTYGKQDSKWQEYLDKIYMTAEKLKADNAKFTGYTTEAFREHCEKLSHIMDDNTAPSLNELSLDISTDDNLIPFMEKHIEKGNTRAFYYEEVKDVEKELMYDLMNQLSKIKFEKTQRKYSISRFLISSGYHEHVHDALNMILQTAVYTINCSSTKKRAAYDFDTDKIYSELKCANVIIERIKYLI